MSLHVALRVLIEIGGISEGFFDSPQNYTQHPPTVSSSLPTMIGNNIPRTKPGLPELILHQKKTSSIRYTHQ